MSELLLNFPGAYYLGFQPEAKIFAISFLATPQMDVQT